MIYLGLIKSHHNFFGAESVTEALLLLLQLSTSPRIVNVSSRIGVLKVKLFPNLTIYRHFIFFSSFIFLEKIIISTDQKLFLI